VLTVFSLCAAENGTPTRRISSQEALGSRLRSLQTTAHPQSDVRHDTAVPLARIAWLVTVAICLVAVALLLLSDYFGYAGVVGAVGLSAAINLR
jgi:hypothetical protein